MSKRAFRLLVVYSVIAAAQVLAFITTAHAQTAGTTFRDCEDCPEMVVIPAGSFLMGADKNFEDAFEDELPRHRVTIGRSFAIGKYEVTQAEWVTFMGGNPSKYKGRSRPVERVSWYDAKEFIRRLSAKTGKVYRLPTEAEWEYAARAGSDSAYFFGDDEGKLRQYANVGANDKGTAPVGQFQPNRFGLYDIIGNVNEWVEDCYVGSYDGAPTDGSARTGLSSCQRRVIRGSGWCCDMIPNFDRSASRSSVEPDFSNDVIGFRVARTLD